MITKKLKLAILVACMAVFAMPTLAQAKGASVSARASVSPSARSISSPSRTSYTRTSTRSITSTKTPVKASTPVKRKSKVEYDYYAVADCTRIVKPINGYRCIDRD